MSPSPSSNSGPVGAPPKASQPRRGFAIPAKLHVGVLFMTQFMFLILFGGGVVPALHAKGVNTILLAIGAVGAVIAFHYVIGLIGRLVPVRCKFCGSRSRFRGYGWWPFIYRYPCGACGQERRIEVTGG